MLRVEAMLDSFEDIKKKAAYVRNIELSEVLKRAGYSPDCRDGTKWHTCRGIISVTDRKFMNWTLGAGGGGAIDLAIHLKQCDFKTAVSWLSKNFLHPYITSKTWKREPQFNKQMHL
jgi:hypothetical protein